jgi:hypothetical protein
LLVIILQDKLEKEEKLAKVNQLKLQNQWRVIMRKMRAEEVQGDVRIMKETFQRKVDCKNALIHSLAKDIVEAEEQYRVALRRHLVKLEEMLAFQQKRIRKLEQEYAEELETLRVEFDKERKGMIAQHEAEMKELRDILYTMELRYRERETDAEHEFQGIMDDLKNKVICIYRVLYRLKTYLEAIFRLSGMQNVKETYAPEKKFLTAVTAFGGHACTESTVPGDAGCTVGGVSETDAGVSAGNRGEEDEIRGSQEERRGECAHHCQTDEQDSETAGIYKFVDVLPRVCSSTVYSGAIILVCSAGLYSRSEKEDGSQYQRQ